ncbi:unnamed protein product [Ixodes pacificus]
MKFTFTEKVSTFYIFYKIEPIEHFAFLWRFTTVTTGFNDLLIH